MDSITFLDSLARAKPQPLYVLHGDEDFLKRQALRGIRQVVLGPNDDGFAITSYPGNEATWANVLEDLQTRPFLSPRRLVVIETADPFVSQERARLEKYLAEVVGKPETTGVLVLDVGTWASNTRLAKQMPDASVLTCKALASASLPQWCAQWCAGRHGKQLATPAARLLVELVGTEMGLLDQEMAKLAVYVGDAPKIEGKDVDVLVGRSATANTWKIFEYIGAGQVKEALDFLQRLLTQGEDPIRLLGAFSMQMRRLALVGRLNAQGVPLGDSMSRASVPPFARAGLEQQLRHLGRRRLDRIHDWLIETDVGLKGGSELPPELQLERLVVRLARART